MKEINPSEVAEIISEINIIFFIAKRITSRTQMSENISYNGAVD
jgi:hypothetical protein